MYVVHIWGILVGEAGNHQSGVDNGENVVFGTHQPEWRAPLEWSWKRSVTKYDLKIESAEMDVAPELMEMFSESLKI